MTDENTKANQSSKQETVTKKTITEGHQPKTIKKGHQPAKPLGNLTAGHQPPKSTLDSNNPPDGGSGVPPVSTQDKTSDTSKESGE